MSFPRTKHSIGDIGYMSVILERIANGTHIYPYLHIWNLSSLPVKYRIITCHDVYIMCHVLPPHRRGIIVPVTYPDCGKINMFKTRKLAGTMQ